MKLLIPFAVILLLCTSSFARHPDSSFSLSRRPDSLRVSLQPGHVQGIAWDEVTGRMYMSFTTRFLVVDREGAIVGSVDRIHGHLGAMAFDAVSRKVYASLECKDDEIGSSISKSLGVQDYAQSSFYVAEIDVDKITTQGVAMEAVMTRHAITPADEDYAAEVVLDGRTLKHRYGCSGIDGVCVAPGFDRDKEKYLYVAYGIYSDTTRTDNDYQVLLQYRMGDFSKPVRRIFIKTGNTTYGVQNMAYDAFTGKLYLAVYKGKKSAYPNYSHFAVDMSAKLSKARLDGVPYEKARVWTAAVCGGWFYKYGSTGFCPLGDGLWYVTEPFKEKAAEGKTLNGCYVRLYSLTDIIFKPARSLAKLELYESNRKSSSENN